MESAMFFTAVSTSSFPLSMLSISVFFVVLATLQSLTQIDGIQKDSIQDFCVNGLQDGSQKTTESTYDSAVDY